MNCFRRGFGSFSCSGFTKMADTITESLTDQQEESVVIPLIDVPSVRINLPSVCNDFLQIKTIHALNPGLTIQQSGATTRRTRKTTGIAFSGGGIRSAAFCSGALRRMLQDDVPLEYLSCVSGGGFTGAAFMDWKYRQETNKWNNKNKWHNEFFEHMRANAGYLCNWQNPILGICQSILLILVVLSVVCILPCTLWLPYALPVAAAVDFLFGEILRENCTSSHDEKQETSSSVMMMDLYNGCQLPVNQILLFTITATVSLVCYMLSRGKNLVRYKGPLKLLATLSGLIFALTVSPWIAHDILWPSKMWVRFLMFLSCLVFPFFFPVIRKSAGLCLRSYVYTYVLSWKVFKVKLMGTVVYSDDVFYPILMVCALFFMFFPVVRSLQQSLFNVYYRYRLTNAFFMHGAKIRCGDIFRWCERPIDEEFRKVGDADDELTLQDLEDISPVFISNITVNDWQIAGADDHGYQLMTFSSEGVKVIGSGVKNGEVLARYFAGRFHPHLMKLSVAMAVSGAAVSFEKEGYQSRPDTILDLFALMGIQMGEEILCDECPEAKIGWKEKITSVVVEIVCIAPLIALPFVYWLGNSKEWVVYLVLLHMAVAVLLASVAVLNTGSIQPAKMERFVRWCVTHIFFVRFFRGFLNINTVGTNSPPVLRLSDGGHFENLALLPLLEKKLQKIVIFDGSCNPGGDRYADSLIHALKMAREKLHCSFTGMNGRDINEDIRVNFLKMKSHQRPRSYRFRVHYYDEEDNQIGQGEILFVAPRHPSESIPLKGIVTEQPTPWTFFGVQLDDPDHKKWGRSPEIAEQEVDRLTGCCCIRCNRNCCQSISAFALGRFPHHITACQFFTPDTFSAYHREGYAACVEADLLEFFKTQQGF